MLRGNIRRRAFEAGLAEDLLKAGGSVFGIRPGVFGRVGRGQFGVEGAVVSVVSFMLENVFSAVDMRVGQVARHFRLKLGV